MLRKLLSALVALSLVMGLTSAPAAAALDGPSITAAAERMQALELIQGRGPEGLALNATITRAELVTVIVRAFGQDELAPVLQSADVFPDTRDHWANGYVAVAKQLIERNNFELGLPDGTFDPDGQVTAAQAVAFLMKFLGVPRETAYSWPMDYIMGAVSAGLITAEDAVALNSQLNLPATRGLVFYLADYAFHNYQMADGKTVYTAYVDDKPPTLSVDALPAGVAETSVTISGTTDAEVVYIRNGEDVVEADVSNGRFSAVVNLQVGPNELTVEAVDLAGNAATETLAITSGEGVPAAIEVSDLTVAAGGTVSVAITVKDANGDVLSDVSVTGTSDVGTFRDGRFTAQSEPGEGTLTLQAGSVTETVAVTVVGDAPYRIIADKEAAAPSTPVYLTVLDRDGNEITGAVLSVSSSNATVDAKGIFVGFEPGSYKVTATKNGVSVSTVIGVYGEADSLKIEPPETMIGNDSAEYTITVSAVDELGYLVADFTDPITLDVPFIIVEEGETENGVATFKVRVPDGYADSEVTLRATSGSLSGRATVQVLPQVATSLEVEMDEYVAVNGGPTDAKVRVLDQVGAPMLNGAWEVSLSITGNGYLTADGDSETTVYADGNGVFFSIHPIDVNHLGPVTVTASAPGLKSGKATAEVVYVFTPSKLSLTQVTTEPVKASEGGVYLLKLQVRDKNGVPTKVTDAAGLSVRLDFGGSKPESLSVAYDTDATFIDSPADFLAHPTAGSVASDGAYYVTVPSGSHTLYVGVMSRDVTGNVTVTAQDAAFAMTKVSSSVSFAAGDLAAISFASDMLTVAPNTEATLTAQLTDEFGNAAAVSGVRVRFSVGDAEERYLTLNGRTGEYLTRTDADGTASVVVKVLGSYAADYEITVEADVDGDGTYELMSDIATLYTAYSITTRITVETWGDTDQDGLADARKYSFRAGDPIHLRAYVIDQNGFPVNDPNFDPDTRLKITGIKLGEDVLEPSVFWSFQDNFTPDPSDDYYEAVLTARKAGSYTITVTDTGVASQVSGSRSVTIGAGDPAQLIVVEELKLVSGQVKAFTVRVADEAGNVVMPSQVTNSITFDVIFTPNGGGYTDVRATATGGRQTTFTISPARNSVTIYLVSNDTAGATLTFTVTDSGTLAVGSPLDGPYDVTVSEQ